MYFLQMLAAFLVLAGMALLMRSLMKVNIGEGFLFGTAGCLLVLFVSGVAGSFTVGIYILLALSAAGVVLWLIRVVKNGKKELKNTFSPVTVFLICWFCLSLVLLYNDFIQHIDEFHYWAKVVRVMEDADRITSGFSLSENSYVTSLFILFFQKFTGYSEQGMYAAEILFVWIGFLLPFSSYGWKDWKKIAVYVVIIYLSMFSLYSYGIKSLYVDVPLAAWSGGLCGWWVNRGTKKTNLAAAISGLILIAFIKPYTGLLMAAFVLLFMLIHAFILDKQPIKKDRIRGARITAGILCGLILLVSAALIGAVMKLTPYEASATIAEETVVNDESAESADAKAEEAEAEDVEAGDADEGDSVDGDTEISVSANTDTGEQAWMIAGIRLPEQLSAFVNSLKISGEKVIKTFGSFATACMGSALASKSNWTIGFLPFVFILLILMKLTGDIFGQQDKMQVYMLYAGFVTFSYSVVLFFSYVFMFEYSLSTTVRSITRYFSVCAIFLFVLLLVQLLQRTSEKKEKLCQYVVLGIAAFFALGLNGKFIPNATALDKEEISGYENLSNIKVKIAQVDAILEDSDRVYYICQYSSGGQNAADLYTAAVSYYLDTQVSDYQSDPWKFTKSGCIIRLEEYDMTIADLPDMLEEGGYTYLWIEKTNSYLTENLPFVLEGANIEDSSLYKIVYINGEARELEFVTTLG
ncbi:MAG: hypothetical protein LUI13_12570 [Lachnospiraceae bacterium]|nr:hypothetical protein [Lachnospiraceae bacterium]